MPGDRPDEVPADPRALPERIGAYRILEVLGKGAMGVVYLAEQREPIRRRVALKLIRPGMDTEFVLRRFEAERQALARMNHPGVAKVFDAGVSEDGRPFFVMEHVAGAPITTYCDELRLGLNERLDLFCQVCDAIQHAHQKEIIHRDVKPSNVLVARDGDRAVVKVIDFGVAKALDHQLTEKTLFTEHGHLVGTPEYMSPEQAGMTGLGVDTRSDVYSLGVLLYELLVGALPFDTETLREAAEDEMLRILREEDPPRPTTRISSLGDRVTDVANRRHTDVRALTRRIEGELEWITMRALEKDPARRYGSPEDFARDIQNHLEQKPVAAAPPSAGYRMKKFARRHQLATVTAVVVLIGLVAGATGITLGLVRALRAEELARAEAERANRESRTADQVVDFMVDLFEMPEPSRARGNTVTAREILDKGAARIGDELTDEPEIQSRLMETMGRVYRSLGLFTSAQTLLEESLESRRQRFGDRSPEVAASLNLLAQNLESRGDYEAAVPLLRESLDLRREIYGDSSPEFAETLNNLGTVLRSMGDPEGAIELYRQALQIDDAPRDRAATQNNLALALQDIGELDEAERIFRATIETMLEVYGEDSPSTAITLNNLGMVLYAKQDYGGARDQFSRAVELNRKVLGEEHPEYANSLGNLATVLTLLGDLEGAESRLRESVRVSRTALGDDHPNVGIALSNLAGVLRDKRDYGSAAAVYGEAVDVMKVAVGPDHWYTAQIRGHYGRTLHLLRRFEDAERELLAGRSGLLSVLGAEHQRTIETTRALVALYEDWDKPEEAARYRELIGDGEEGER